MRNYAESAIANYFTLVHYVLKRFRPVMAAERLEYEDMFQVGCIGLLRAIRTYREGAGSSFRSFAIQRIANDICNYINRRDELIKASQRVRQLTYRIRRLGMEDSSPDAIALRLDCSVAMARKAQEWMNVKLVLVDQEPYFTAYSQPTFNDQSGVYVSDYLERLSPTEKRVVALKMRGFNLKDIGQQLGFSRAKVWRALHNAREALQRIGATAL